MPQAALVARKGARPDDAQARQFWPLTLGAIGVVYGDIGTSPIYAFREAVVAATGEAAGHAGHRAGHPLADRVVAAPARHAQVRVRSPARRLQRRGRHLCVDGAGAVGGPAQQAADPAARHRRRVLPLRRCRHHAGALRHIRRRGPEGHRAGLREGGGAPVDRHSGRAVCHAEPRHRQGGRLVRPDHPRVVRRPRRHRRRSASPRNPACSPRSIRSTA